jgi:hypothetical protein
MSPPSVTKTERAAEVATFRKALAREKTPENVWNLATSSSIQGPVPMTVSGLLNMPSLSDPPGAGCRRGRRCRGTTRRAPSW